MSPPLGLVAWILAACGPDKGTVGGRVTHHGGDTGEAEADADGDADADTDTDADGDADTDTGAPDDADGDGYLADVDCDDGDAAVNPGAAEVCGNGADDNCDGSIAGCTGEVEADAAEGVIVGTVEQAWASLEGFTDLDEDGADEVVVAMRALVTDDQLSLYFFETPIAGTVDNTAAIASLLTGTACEQLGTPAIADFDGDGIRDVAVGSPNEGVDDDGMVFVVPGPIAVGDDVSRASLRVEGTAPDAGLGNEIRSGDFDADGTPDLVVDEYSHDRVWIVRMPATGTVRLFEAVELDLSVEVSRSSWAGLSKAVADYDGDGFDDLIAGAFHFNLEAPNQGAVHVLLGPITALRTAADADATIVAESEGYFGTKLVTGDSDGDGTADLLVSDWTNDHGGNNAGRVWLFDEPSSGIVGADTAASAIIDGEHDTMMLGRGLALGDADADGRDDLLLGAGYSSEAFLFWAAPSGALTTADADIRFRSDEEDGFGSQTGFSDLDSVPGLDPVVDAMYNDQAAVQGGAIHFFPSGSLF